MTTFTFSLRDAISGIARSSPSNIKAKILQHSCVTDVSQQVERIDSETWQVKFNTRFSGRIYFYASGDGCDDVYLTSFAYA